MEVLAHNLHHHHPLYKKEQAFRSQTCLSDASLFHLGGIESLLHALVTAPLLPLFSFIYFIPYHG